MKLSFLSFVALLPLFLLGTACERMPADPASPHGAAAAPAPAGSSAPAKTDEKPDAAKGKAEPGGAKFFEGSAPK